MNPGKIIPLFLKDVYGTVESSPLYKFEFEEKQPKFFEGDKILDYLLSEKSNTKNKVVTLVINGLVNVYWEKRAMIPDEMVYLNNAINQPDPEYDPISGRFQGIITPYDIVHLSAEDFIDHVGNGEPILIKLVGIDTIIQI